MNIRNIFAMMAMLFMVACSGSNSKSSAPIATLDPAKANTAAQTYVGTLYADKGVKGPVCMPEAVVDGYTQCSFTYQESSSASEGEAVASNVTQVATILCNNSGCMEGDAPTMMSADIAPESYSDSGGSVSDDWLFWYMLYNSGGTTHHYHGWYDSTPSYGRSGYYSHSYTPSAQSRTYYTSSYSTPVKKTSTTRYSGKTSGHSTSKRKSSSSKKSTSGSKSTSSSKSSGSKKTTSSKKSSSTKKSSRSSGYGSSKRSSGSRRRR